MWERTNGNRLDAPADDPSGWLLQTPGCWGDAGCKDRAGTRRLLDKMTRNIADARHTVDISSLAPFPNGGFEDAVVAGLKASVKVDTPRGCVSWSAPPPSTTSMWCRPATGTT